MDALSEQERTAPSAASWMFAEDFAAESDAATKARQEAEDLGVKPVSPGTAGALTLLARLVRASHVVEIGTGSGVSGLALYAGMVPDGILTSVDIEPEHQRIARQAFTEVGIESRRIRLIAGAALSVLPRLSDGAYDLVFVDGDKLEYPDYIEQALRLLRPGGVLAVDNALWHDRVADRSQDDDETLAVRETLDRIRDDDDLISSLLPCGDGLLIAVTPVG
ncbi:O-methyltransferase [Microlunatus parietis]|uniref:Putative O-methyltransferase YrrM n=1 Tax=Microlunatus parietis TaxID=682979 RepID=A0A7Y9I4R4_9ACTN|nr:O-methyltransferase [Microlunatus parietis]NYE70256.1 putative O-methyltransferase YrrM [Microlunatus parietis]